MNIEYFTFSTMGVPACQYEVNSDTKAPLGNAQFLYFWLIPVPQVAEGGQSANDM